MANGDNSLITGRSSRYREAQIIDLKRSIDRLTKSMKDIKHELKTNKFKPGPNANYDEQLNKLNDYTERVADRMSMVNSLLQKNIKALSGGEIARRDHVASQIKRESDPNKVQSLTTLKNLQTDIPAKIIEEYLKESFEKATVGENADTIINQFADYGNRLMIKNFTATKIGLENVLKQRTSLVKDLITPEKKERPDITKSPFGQLFGTFLSESKKPKSKIILVNVFNNLILGSIKAATKTIMAKAKNAMIALLNSPITLFTKGIPKLLHMMFPERFKGPKKEPLDDPITQKMLLDEEHFRRRDQSTEKIYELLRDYLAFTGGDPLDQFSIQNQKFQLLELRGINSHLAQFENDIFRGMTARGSFTANPNGFNLADPAQMTAAMNDYRERIRKDFNFNPEDIRDIKIEKYTKKDGEEALRYRKNGTFFKPQQEMQDFLEVIHDLSKKQDVIDRFYEDEDSAKLKMFFKPEDFIKELSMKNVHPQNIFQLANPGPAHGVNTAPLFATQLQEELANADTETQNYILQTLEEINKNIIAANKASTKSKSGGGFMAGLKSMGAEAMTLAPLALLLGSNSITRNLSQAATLPVAMNHIVNFLRQFSFITKPISMITSKLPFLAKFTAPFGRFFGGLSNVFKLPVFRTLGRASGVLSIFLMIKDFFTGFFTNTTEGLIGRFKNGFNAIVDGIGGAIDYFLPFNSHLQEASKYLNKIGAFFGRTLYDIFDRFGIFDSKESRQKEDEARTKQLIKLGVDPETFNSPDQMIIEQQNKKGAAQSAADVASSIGNNLNPNLILDYRINGGDEPYKRKNKNSKHPHQMALDISPLDYAGGEKIADPISPETSKLFKDTYAMLSKIPGIKVINEFDRDSTAPLNTDRHIHVQAETEEAAEYLNALWYGAKDWKPEATFKDLEKETRRQMLEDLMKKIEQSKTKQDINVSVDSPGVNITTPPAQVVVNMETNEYDLYMRPVGL